MRLRWVLIGTVAVVLPAPAGVSAQQNTACEATVDVHFSPGLSSTPSSGTFTSRGETGTVRCDGPVNGRRPTGSGTFGVSGHYGTRDGDTCASGGEGDAVQGWTIPTDDGDEKIADQQTFTYGALSGGSTFGGEFKGERYSGTFEVTPQDGDCFTRPLTTVRAVVRWTLPG
jgi:hypothetical protein